jgi:hypothetical protein
VTDEIFDQLWGRRVANHRLASGILPPCAASAEMLLMFGGTFDGYLVRSLPEMGDWVAQLLRDHARGRLPALGLTMARAALFGFTRWHHHTTWDGSLPGDWRRCMQQLVEQVRTHVLAREAGRDSAPDPVARVEDSVMDAYERFLEEYARWGGYRFHGWTDFPDTRNYQGPVIWSEADCAMRFALELEREFPRSVHLEFAIGKATRLDYEPDVEKRQRIDIVVSDLATFVEDESSQQRFQTHQHSAFVETKWLVKGWRGQRFERDAVKRAASVAGDITRLARSLQLGRCLVAAMLVIDDEEFYSQSAPAADEENARVWRLIASPQALQDRGLTHIDFTADQTVARRPASPSDGSAKEAADE